MGLGMLVKHYAYSHKISTLEHTILVHFTNIWGIFHVYKLRYWLMFRSNESYGGSRFSKLTHNRKSIQPSA